MDIKLLHPNAQKPTYGTEGAAGMDLHACLEDPVTLKCGERITIPTGLAIVLPESTVGLIYMRSGLATKHGLTLTGSVGVVDEDYRGEMFVPIINHGSEDYTISCGDRIAQLVVTPYKRVEFNVVEELPETGRGKGGFGSTGR
jgi:deoxyuridine 5''-triphosphate nucleotidohydrolase (dut)